MLWTGYRKGGFVDRWITDDGGMVGLTTDGGRMDREVDN